MAPEGQAPSEILKIVDDKLGSLSGEDWLAALSNSTGAVGLLIEIQKSLYAEAKTRLDANIKGGVTDWKSVEDYFAGSDEDFKGWLKVSWSKPTGAELEAVDTKLKGLKLTIRNAPLEQPGSYAPCLFTGRDGVEEILIGRAY